MPGRGGRQPAVGRGPRAGKRPPNLEPWEPARASGGFWDTHRPLAPGRQRPGRCPLAGSPPSAPGSALASRRRRRPLLTTARPPRRGGAPETRDGQRTGPLGVLQEAPLGRPAHAQCAAVRVPAPPRDAPPLIARA